MSPQLVWAVLKYGSKSNLRISQQTDPKLRIWITLTLTLSPNLTLNQFSMGTDFVLAFTAQITSSTK